MSYCIAIIPARGGSKGLPGKNIRPLLGKPLIAWSIDLALGMPEIIQEVWVTTDSTEIAKIAKDSGAKVWMRPASLAQDDSPVSLAVLDALTQNEVSGGVKPTHFVLLEPTSPLRTKSLVKTAVDMIQTDSAFNSSASFSPVPVNPHRIWKIVNHQPKTFIEGVNPWLPRQQLPQAHFIDGAVYAVRTKAFESTKGNFFAEPCGAVMSPPGEIVDIDHEIDFQIAEIKAKLKESRQP